MKCFECGNDIVDESAITHMGDGDFVHNECVKDFEEKRNTFFDNIGNNEWYNDWLNK